MQSEINVKPVLNLAFYRFVNISNPQELAEKLTAFCAPRGLKGTILLATEGINGMLAGKIDQAEELVAFLTADPAFETMPYKRSYSDQIPFNNLFIKVKKEIITFRQPGLDVVSGAAPYVKPSQLDQWIDAGEDMILVDTRNDFEVKMGTFKGAINPEIPTFTKFADYVQNEMAGMKNKKIVTFCTGGIRCEKATAFLKQKGFTNVFQLEGGILEYLHQTPGKNFEGKCFVFDERTTL